MTFDSLRLERGFPVEAPSLHLSSPAMISRIFFPLAGLIATLSLVSCQSPGSGTSNALRHNNGVPVYGVGGYGGGYGGYSGSHRAAPC